MINDSIGDLPLVIVIDNDNASFHVFDRRIQMPGSYIGVTMVVHFTIDKDGLHDIETNSLWNTEGLCLEGSSKGQQLKKIQASQEFWHSWKSFHPGTTIYK